MKTPRNTCRRGHNRTPENAYQYHLPDGSIHYFCKVCRDMRRNPQHRNTGKNEVRTCGATTFLLLQQGKEAIVDLVEVGRIISAGRWTESAGYVFNKRLSISLHRFIINAPKDLDVDHINRNTLDCRLSNLRLVSTNENCQNQTLCYRKSVSGHKNVHWEKHVQKWKVRVKHLGLTYYGGYYDDLEIAIRKASEMRRQLHSHCPENSLTENG